MSSLAVGEHSPSCCDEECVEGPKTFYVTGKVVQGDFNGNYGCADNPNFDAPKT